MISDTFWVGMSQKRPAGNKFNSPQHSQQRNERQKPDSSRTKKNKKKRVDWRVPAAGDWKLFPFITSKTCNTVAAWGGIFVYRFCFLFWKRKKKHLWYIYRKKLIAKDKLLNWGDGEKKKVTNKSKSNSGGNCDNSPTKLAPSSPVSPGLKRQRWIK